MIKIIDDVYDKLKQVVYTFTNGNLCESDTFEFVNRFIEVYEQSKWVKFDVDDESTYPPLENLIMCKTYKGNLLLLTLVDYHPRLEGVFLLDDESGVYYNLEDMKYWQLLPEFKE